MSSFKHKDDNSESTHFTDFSFYLILFNIILFAVQSLLVNLNT